MGTKWGQATGVRPLPLQSHLPHVTSAPLAEFGRGAGCHRALLSPRAMTLLSTLHNEYVRTLGCFWYETTSISKPRDIEANTQAGKGSPTARPMASAGPLRLS